MTYVSKPRGCIIIIPAFLVHDLILLVLKLGVTYVNKWKFEYVLVTYFTFSASLTPLLILYLAVRRVVWESV